MRQAHEVRTSHRVVVLGASGMLGSTVLRELSGRGDLAIRGTVRNAKALPSAFLEELGPLLIDEVDVTNPGTRAEIVASADVIINAVGVIKQASGLHDHVGTVKINALLPHQLAAECRAAETRLVHISTDCVFSGHRGRYDETSMPDPTDFYGRSKLLGEVDEPALTLRTSIIGHEVHRHASLVDWFLSRPETQVNGFVNAIYSGVTTPELAALLADVVLNRPELKGLYHVASEPISKFDLLSLVAEQYGWGGKIEPYEDFRCDRSMRGDRLAAAIGYRPPSWPEMVRELYERRPAWSVTPRTKESSA